MSLSSSSFITNEVPTRQRRALLSWHLQATQRVLALKGRYEEGPNPHQPRMLERELEGTAKRRHRRQPFPKEGFDTGRTTARAVGRLDKVRGDERNATTHHTVAAQLSILVHRLGFLPAFFGTQAKS
jgi:hypothetical protein